MVYTGIYVSLVNKMDTKKRRATEFIWSKNTYKRDQIVQEPGIHVLCYFQDGPDRAFVLEDLMHTPEDTQVPPNKVSGWK